MRTFFFLVCGMVFGWCIAAGLKARRGALSLIGIAGLTSLVLLSLSGCTALQTPHERAWLALHAVDTAQTLNIVDDPCIEEAHPITRELIGRRPSTESVVVWSLGTAALHAGVTEWLLRSDRPLLAKAWSYVTLGEKALTVGANHFIGIRVGGSNKKTCEPWRPDPLFTPGNPNAQPIKL